MPSLLSALVKLDSALQALQPKLERLRAGLEVNDDELVQALADARQHGAMLRHLVRTERPDAEWGDRRSLDELICELEAAAEARRQQRRARLLELAEELEAGRARHRFDTRAAALNTLRLAAVNELRREAAATEEVKDIPGPGAAEWLHWACNLQDSTDGEVLMCLRRDFDAVERFAGEMEESYWMRGSANQGSPGLTAELSPQPAEEPQAEAPLPSSSSQQTWPARPAHSERRWQGDTPEGQPPASTAEGDSFEQHTVVASQIGPAVAGTAGTSDMRSVAAGDLHSASPAPVGTAPSPDFGILASAERPAGEIARKPGDAEYEELQATVRWHYSAADQPAPNLLQRLLGKRQ